MISSYLIVVYLGNSLPVIGVGVLSALWAELAAFAAAIALLAAITLPDGAMRRGWTDTTKMDDGTQRPAAGRRSQCIASVCGADRQKLQKFRGPARAAIEA